LNSWLPAQVSITEFGSVIVWTARSLLSNTCHTEPA